MQNGPYIAERLVPHVIRDICVSRSIAYSTLSDDWVLRLEQNGVVRWVVGYKFDANSAAASELAQDKVATYMTLAAADMPAIEHYLVRAVSSDPNESKFDASMLAGRPVVIKPLDGTGGRAVDRYESAAEALRIIHESAEPAWAISPYYELTTEYRLIMLGDVLLLSLEKTQPTMRGKLKLFNLGYGAAAVDITDADLLSMLTDMARQVMHATALGLAAVDIVRTAEGDLRVLEVNDGIKLEHYMQQSETYKNRAAQVYEAIVDKMFR